MKTLCSDVAGAASCCSHSTSDDYAGDDNGSDDNNNKNNSQQRKQQASPITAAEEEPRPGDFSIEKRKNTSTPSWQRQQENSSVGSVNADVVIGTGSTSAGKIMAARERSTHDFALAAGSRGCSYILNRDGENKELPEARAIRAAAREFFLFEKTCIVSMSAPVGQSSHFYMIFGTGKHF